MSARGKRRPDEPRSPLSPAADDVRALLAGEHWCPHSVLGAHPLAVNGQAGVVFRVYHPDAAKVEIVFRHDEVAGLAAQRPIAPDERVGPLLECEAIAPGLFAAFLPGIQAPPPPYRQRFHFADGHVWERDDPYRFLPTVGEQDLYLFNEGTHRRLWDVLGARERHLNGVQGVSFAVWAPNARRVSVVGDFCQWDGRLLPMRSLGNSGVWELFVPGVHPGATYKYEIKTAEGALRIKTDPMAAAMEVPPGTASRVYVSSYDWNDADWMAQRAQRDPHNSPMAIYELHLGSWARVPEENRRPLTYRELAPKLVEHVKRLGFNYVELMPVAEHPFSGSWGYQVSGYYAPTSRFGSPDDFRYFVDYCHRHGVGVLIDWVPAHFPKDDFALARFDGSALYEHSDPRLGEHPDWGTLIFNYGRHEVRCFLIANALYWLKEFHVDGLRVDAVASMLYLDYSRKQGEWVPNKYGDNRNLEAIEFLQSLNEIVRHECPGCMTIAEESTAYAGVSKPVSAGGLGFTFKWNMGWMHDTLVYFAKDPIHRRYHQWQLSFAMVYEYHEHFIMPISHDEVVHGKRALLEKMPGDLWQRFANVRLLLAYQFTRPGKKLQFMGFELGQFDEWNHEHSLPWHLADDHWRQGLYALMADLGETYHRNPAFWRHDHDPRGFNWISYDDADNSVLAYARRDGEKAIVVVLNFTPVPRDGYRIGVPGEGEYIEWLSTDDARYAGSNYATVKSARTEPIAYHGYPQSIVLKLPPLGAVILALTTYRP